MAIRNYVGARYVPKFADPVDWQSNTSYEAMVIVTYNNSSYTSKVPVPPTVGNPAENPKYWALTGNYNAQVEEYRQATDKAQEHARDGICAADEGNNTTATKDHIIYDYFWWNGKLCRAKNDIRAGDLLNASNVEESNVANGVSANTIDIDNITRDVNTNTHDIGNLVTKTNTNTTDINELKTKTDTNTNSINNLTTALSGKIQYKVYTTTRRKLYQQITTDNASFGFNQDRLDSVETIPDGVTLIPISAQYHYFATDEEYNDSNNEGHDLSNETMVNISPLHTINNKSVYTIIAKSPTTFTAVGWYWTFGVLEIK